MISDAKNDTAKEQPSQVDPNGIVLFISSNTVMAVVPDSNRIPFLSTQCTTFQTVSSIISYLIYIIVTLFLLFCKMVKHTILLKNRTVF